MGSVKAVWSCVDGHRYIMDTQGTTATDPADTVCLSSGMLRSDRHDGVTSEEEEQEVEKDEQDQRSRNGRMPVGGISTLAENNRLADMAQIQNLALTQWTTNSEGERSSEGRWIY